MFKINSAKITKLAILFILFSSVVSIAEPIPRFDKIDVDLGSYPANIQKKVVFKLTNIGDEDLKIVKLRKTCSCSSVGSSKKTIKPGETADVTFILDGGFLNGKFTRTIFVQTNSNTQTFVMLKVSGEAVPVSEPNLDYHTGRLKVGEEWVQEFHFLEHRGNILYGVPVVNGDLALSIKLNDSVEGKVILIARYSPEKVIDSFQSIITVPIVEPVNEEPIVIRVSGSIGSE